MVPINRRKVSLYEEAKNGLSSLVWQTTTVFVGFIFMLLLTGGNPSGFAITLSFVLSIAFVAWREQNRFTKLRKDSDGSLDAINKRMRPQKRNRDLRVIKGNNRRDISALGTNPLSDVFSVVKANLQQAASNPVLFTQIFGDKANTSEFQAIVSQWKVGDFSQLPTVQVISAADMNGVLIEETFHWLDNRVSTDIQGDEGELAKNLLFGASLNDPSKTLLLFRASRSDSSQLRYKSASSDIKARLFELRAAIIEHENLTDKNKADALVYLEAIAEISLQQNETTSQTLPAKPFTT